MQKIKVLKNKVFRFFTEENRKPFSDILDAREMDFIQDEIDELSTVYEMSGLDDYEPWIAAPFRYPLPVAPQFASRFIPPGSMRHCFYSSTSEETAAFETAYHFLRFRVASSANFSTSVEVKTLGSVDWDNAGSIEAPEKLNLKNDYVPSHRWIENNENSPSVIYTSARDPHLGKNVAIFNIKKLARSSSGTWSVGFSYENKHAIIRSSYDLELPERVAYKIVS